MSELSHSQVRIALLHLYYKNIPIYNLSFELNLDGEIDIMLLEKSLNFLLYRFPQLKTNIKLIDDKLVKSFSNGKIKITVFDNTNLEKNDIEITKFNNIYLDIENELLIKVLYLKNINKLLFLFSDILIDGTTIITYFKNLEKIYNTLLYKNSLALKSPNVNNIDFISEKTLQFWKDNMNKDCITYLKVKNNDDTFLENRVRFSIEKSDFIMLKNKISNCSTTLFNFLTGQFLLFLRMISKQDCITIDTIIGNLDTDDIGLFKDMVLIPFNFKDSLKNSLAYYIQESSEKLNMIKKHTVSLEYLTNKLNLENLPNIRIHFEYANKNIDKHIYLGKSKLSSNGIENTANTIRQLLIFNVCEFNDKLECYFSYRKSAFDVEYIKQLIEIFKLFLTNDTTISLDKVVNTDYNNSFDGVLYKSIIDKRLISYKSAGKYPNILYSDFKKELDKLK